jgi:crooked neck
LYEQLIALSRHVKVWISYVLFEAEPIPVPRAERGRERRKVKMMLSPRPFPCETGI